jgi:hypothetical protein
MAEADQAWARSHKNGRVALVFRYGDGRFSAGAVPVNGTSSIQGNVAGPLERAQAYADQQSGCKQRGNCPPWKM